MSTDLQIRIRNGAAIPEPDSDGRFAWVEYQICQVTLGYLDSISCPYCGSSVRMGVEKMCCDPIGEATATVLRRMEALTGDASQVPIGRDQPILVH